MGWELGLIGLEHHLGPEGEKIGFDEATFGATSNGKAYISRSSEAWGRAHIAAGCCDHEAIVPDEEMHRHHPRNLAEADGFLCGRVIYEMMEEAWRDPAETGVIPDWMEPFAKHDPRREEVRSVDHSGAGRTRSS